MRLSNTSPSPTFFFDRDGIVNQRIMDGYVTDTDEFMLLPDFLPLFRLVKSSGVQTILVTNQQGVGKGLMTEEDLAGIHAFMQETLQREAGSGFDDIFSATELDKSRQRTCCGDRPTPNRRKPSPAMLLEAAEKWNIDLAASWMIGDSRSDAEAGRAAGTSTILVGEFLPDEADIVVPSLNAATKAIARVLAEGRSFSPITA